MTTSSPVPSLSSSAIRHVETELYTYPETLKAIADREREIIEGGLRPEPGERVPGRDDTQWSDPTAFRGSLLADDLRLRELRRIAGAIEVTERCLSAEGQAVLRLWYWERRSADEVARGLSIDRATVYRWRRGVLVAVAGRLGWL